MKMQKCNLFFNCGQWSLIPYNHHIIDKSWLVKATNHQFTLHLPIVALTPEEAVEKALLQLNNLEENSNETRTKSE